MTEESITNAIEEMADRLHAHEVEAMPFNADYFVPVRTSLAVINVITPEQRAKVLWLIEGYRPNSVSLYRDDFNTESILFTLYRSAEPSSDEIIIGGLIEADGRSHT